MRQREKMGEALQKLADMHDMYLNYREQHIDTG